MIVDGECPSVATQTPVPATSHMPLAADIAAAAAAEKHRKYCDVRPHTMLPFVVEHAGGHGINKEGMDCSEGAGRRHSASCM